jgi:hypothetical protein
MIPNNSRRFSTSRLPYVRFFDLLQPLFKRNQLRLEIGNLPITLVASSTGICRGVHHDGDSLPLPPQILQNQFFSVNGYAYVTTQADGTTLILFRTWQGKGSNLRGILYTNGAPHAIGSEIELITFIPHLSDDDLPIDRVNVSIDASLAETCYRVSC